jgi:hypothetical protein
VYLVKPWLNLKNKKHNIKVMIFLKGLEIILYSIRLKVFIRIENYRFLFWENQEIFSNFKFKKRIGKFEYFFYDIYNFILNCYEWETGIKSGYFSNFYLQPSIKNFGKKTIFSKNIKQVETHKCQYSLKKHTLSFPWSEVMDLK